MSSLRTSRTTLKRLPARGAHDFEDVARILDAGLYCHVGFVVDGQPYVIPTGYGREDRTLYIHGSSASRMLRTLAAGVPVCVSVSLIDGLVLARSAFHHSVNYRSVTVLGTAHVVPDTEKNRALRIISEHIIPGRWDDVREPNEQELKATMVLRLPIEEASAKVRSGPPVDDEEDYARECWAGELPLVLAPRWPVPDPRLRADATLPQYIRAYHRPYDAAATCAPSVGRDAALTLREITRENLRDVLRLRVAPSQERFVAPNDVSVAEASLHPTAWHRAIYADDVPVGFAMIDDQPEKPEYYLWRFMIDQRYQGLGFGARALELLIDYVRTRPRASELLLSCVPGEGSPCSFYERRGFVYTGAEDHGELVMRLDLTRD